MGPRRFQGPAGWAVSSLATGDGYQPDQCPQEPPPGFSFHLLPNLEAGMRLVTPF